MGVVQDERKRCITMKKTRGTRMAAAVRRAAKVKGGKGPVRSRAVGLRIMRT